MTTVTVAPELLERLAREDRRPGSEHGSPAFLVRAEDVELAASALHAASLRLITIDEEGDELEEWANTGETYTPSWVSPVYLSADGPWLTVDSQGVFSAMMVRAMIDVVVEELMRRDVDARVEEAPWGLVGQETWQPPTPAPMDPEPDGPRAWVITRTRRRHTTTGRMWWDWEYFTSGGTWTPDSRRALLFPDMPPHGLVRALIADHPGQPAFGPIGSTHARVDGYERAGSKPPRELRLDD
ncbi:MAG: hypothetical protein WCA30_11380 [Dermatophilaceae bacterium]